jgi:hypothetical protein
MQVINGAKWPIIPVGTHSIRNDCNRAGAVVHGFRPFAFGFFETESKESIKCTIEGVASGVDALFGFSNFKTTISCATGDMCRSFHAASREVSVTLFHFACHVPTLTYLCFHIFRLLVVRVHGRFALKYQSFYNSHFFILLF